MDNRKEIEEIIRVDLAGEKGAIEIYKGQLAVIKNKALAKDIKEMLKKEEKHFEKFSELLIKYQVRPTILDPLWKSGAFGLGLLSAALGEKATMACTEAVEEVIVEHYQNQSNFLKGKDSVLEKVTKKFAADEKEHMEQAKNYDTGNDIFHRSFKFGVKCLSKVAIKLSKKI
ncbi:demethoxyubiquinone hydroxylase family protein [Alphaproteobacteria bacterium]|nr:demethoxyubiquinone hydroxylase family protein [Alphaproteobacteria bacterium]